MCFRKLRGPAGGNVPLSSQRSAEWLYQVPGDDWDNSGHEPGLTCVKCKHIVMCLPVLSVYLSVVLCIDWPPRVPGEGVVRSGVERAERKDGCTGKEHAGGAEQLSQRTRWQKTQTLSCAAVGINNRVLLPPCQNKISHYKEKLYSL